MYLELNQYLVTVGTWAIKSEGRGSSWTDYDILAVRFPHAKASSIGELETIFEPDTPQSERDRTRTIRRRRTGETKSYSIFYPRSDVIDVVVGEVKSKGATRPKFLNERLLKYAVSRIGCFEDEKVNQAIQVLKNAREYQDQGIVVRKVMFCGKVSPALLPEIAYWKTLGDVIRFIYSRFRSYPEKQKVSYRDPLYGFFKDLITSYKNVEFKEPTSQITKTRGSD